MRGCIEREIERSGSRYSPIAIGNVVHLGLEAVGVIALVAAVAQ